MKCDILTPKKLKRRFLLYVFDWNESSNLRLRQWQHILQLETYIIDAGDIPYDFLGAWHMWRTVLGESWLHFGWHHEGRKLYGGKTISEGEPYPRRHFGIVALDKNHYNFLVPLFSLQFSRIPLWIKRNLSIHSVLQ